MIFSTYPRKKEEIYNKHLQKISGIRFTFREVDIIACIIHNRGEKKIASLLSISHRTVGSHIRNIMGKFGYSSREYIIDVAEKSGKLQYFRQYYFHLVVELSFVRTLQKIAALINRSGIICSIDFGKATEEKSKLLQQIEQHLNLANITLTNINSAKISLAEHKAVSGDNTKDTPEGTIDKNIAYNLYVVSKDIATEIISEPYQRGKEKREKENSDTDNNGQNISNNKNDNNIALIFDTNTDLSLFKDLKLAYVDFRVQEDYYFSIFKLVEKIIGKTTLEQIIQEFKDEYQSLQKSWQGTVLNEVKSANDKFTGKIIFIIMLVILCISIAIALIFFTSKNETAISYNILQINQEFAKFVGTLSADNTTASARSQNNYRLITEVEKIVAYFENQQVQDYFTSNELPADELINCLYVLHALSSQYTYNESNGRKARKLLEYAKNFAELYIINKTNSQIAFDELTAEELYIELNIIRDLPEMYAKTIYSLGRTYIYQDNIAESVRYFQLSKYLGNKLGIFEGYLSIRSGLEVIRKKQIDDYIGNGHFIEAAKQLYMAIKLMQKLKDDNREYKLNYRPGNVHPEIIIPKNDITNIVLCSEQIVKYYSKLIMVNKDTAKNLRYLKEVENLFIGTESAAGLLGFLDKLVGRRAASVYNSLGSILLRLYEYQINFDRFRQALINKLGLKEKEDLQVIEQIFNLAKLNSRNTDYTKADSYDGLIRVYRKIIEQEATSIDRQSKLKSEIADLTIKRDIINNKLGRTDWRLMNNL